MEDKSGLRRIYRKSWCFDNLFGSLRHELNVGQRGMWNDLLDMAKLSRVRPGLISPAEGVGYSHQWLSDFLNIPFEFFEETLELLEKTGRISENHNGIEIINWWKYQSEYDRQKPYRDGKRTSPGVSEVNRITRARIKKLGRLLNSDEIQEIRDSVQGCIEEGGSTEKLINEWEAKE